MAHGARSNLWGWTVNARSLLAGSALTSAVLLLTFESRGPRDSPIDPTLVVDPNSVPAAVLLALPRLGPVLVGRIVAERDRQPIGSLDDLDARVRGVGPATVAALRPYLRFGPDRRAVARQPGPGPLAPDPKPAVNE